MSGLTLTFAFEILHETDDAILVEKDPDIWLPKSKIEYDETASTGDTIDVEVPEWLAEDRGLI